MSDFSHDRHKFADSGLMLRLPVDLIPANQYGELTNALPVIEGELRSREGVTFIATLYTICALASLQTPNPTISFADTANTIYPHGFSVGDIVVLSIMANDPAGPNTVNPGTYTVTVLSITPTQFLFTPQVPVTWNNMSTIANVFGQATNAGIDTTLTQYDITTLFRLNQAIPSITGTSLAVLEPGRLYGAPLPGGTPFAELVPPSLAGEPPNVPATYTNNPFSIIGFRFTDDTASWAIIANPGRMSKFRYGPGNAPLYFLLGNPIPLAPATAVAGASGNLNSTGGTDYDWRYTYYDGYVNTEGNPSPSPDSGSVVVELATAQLTPEPFRSVSAGGYFTINNAAFGGVSNIGGTSSVLQSPAQRTENVSSCQWSGFSNPVATAFITTLNVSWQAQINSPGGSLCVVELNYSTNGGVSWVYLAQNKTSFGQTTASVVLPLGTDLTQVIVECYGYIPAWNFGTYQPTAGYVVTINNIEIDVNTDPTPTLLALTNQTAVVTVQLPGALNDGRVTGIRLYRRGGSLPDAWRLVGTFPLSGLTQTPVGKTTLLGTDAGPWGSPSTAWTNPNNVTSSVAYATALLTVGGANGYSDWIYATQFGFSLAAGTPIQGIVVTFSAMQSVGSVGYFVVTLLQGGVPIGTWNGLAGTPPASVKTSLGTATPVGAPITFTFGGPADVWGSALAAADLNAGNFGVAVFYTNAASSGGGRTTTISINNVQVNVYDGYTTIIDNIGDATLETQPILELDNDAPVTSVTTLNQPLSFIWGPVGIEARVCGVGDPNRPECVYFSKPGNPDAWPPENFLVVSEPGTPMIAGCTYNTRIYAFSREHVYELVEGVTSDVFTPFITPSAHGLFTPWGLAVGPMIYFVAKDGIYASTGGQETSIVENDIKPLFPTYDTPGQPIEAYDAVDMTQPDAIRLTYFNSELYFVYMGQTTQALQMLVYDILKKRWRAAVYAVTPTVPYSEPNTTSSLLLGLVNGQIYSNGGNMDPLDAPIGIRLRTGAHDQGEPLNQKQYGNVLFDLDPGGAFSASPVTITPYINGEVANRPAIQVTGTGRQQVALDLSDYFAYNTEFQIEWSGASLGSGEVVAPVLYQYDILYFLEPASVTHWQAQPTSFEFPGFMHLRDAYIAIRSTVDVTLTMTIDNGTGTSTVQTYTVPSTAGQRRKVYVQFAPNKGLLYQMALDSVDGTTQFRVYQQDLELRVKPWLGVMGYAIMRTLGGEAQ